MILIAIVYTFPVDELIYFPQPKPTRVPFQHKFIIINEDMLQPLRKRMLREKPEKKHKETETEPEYESDSDSEASEASEASANKESDGDSDNSDSDDEAVVEKTEDKAPKKTESKKE